MPWGDDRLRFMKRVLPWPASPTDAGYGNIHWTMPNTKRPGAAPWWVGKAFKSAEEACGLIGWLYGKPDVLDVYFCTSLQAQTKKNTKGKEVAHRDQANTICSKVLFLDIDVKDPPKGYATIEEAKAELVKFLKHWHLPPPTALVASGGGLHVYWISTKTLTPAEWQPLAESLRAAGVHFGLRFDGQCTVDITRVLRPPETQNCKTEPKRLVKLLYLDDNDLDFDAGLKQALAAVPAIAQVTAPVTLAQQPGAPPATMYFDPNVFKKRATPPEFAGVESGAAGLEPEAPPLDEKAIFSGCPWLREAARTGGEFHDQPQWNMAALATTFLKNGRPVLHALSDRHKGYDPSVTDALYDRKDRERAAKNMGWPSCAAIEQAGSKECATCPLRGTMRSPFNLGNVKPNPAPVTGSVTFLPAGADLWHGYSRYDLPDGYAFDQKGYVCKVVNQKEKDADGNVEYVPVLIPILNEQHLLAPWCTIGPDTIQFQIDGSVGALRDVKIEREYLTSPADCKKILGRQGVAFNPDMQNMVGDFLMSLMRKMEIAIKSAVAKPMGWLADGTDENAPRNKFVFGGVTFNRDGTRSQGSYIDDNMKAQYAPIGKRDAWIDAAKFVLARGRPEYEVMLAAGYAAPLFQFSGQNLGVLNYYGVTGIGKSTVLKITAAMWGHPESSRIVQNATGNMVGHKMGIVANIPVIWDELSDTPSQDAIIAAMMQDGIERQRLVARAGLLTVRVSGNWSTMAISTSNYSLVDYIAVKQKDNDAGRMRVFEIKVDKIYDDEESHWNVDHSIIEKLRFNYGNIGMEYASFLATRSAELPELVKNRGIAFDKKVRAKNDERYWSVMCSTILLGAEFARDLGHVQFDVQRLENFLIDKYFDQRRKRKTGTQEGSDAAIELLSAFFKDHAQNVLITDGLPGRGGARNKTPFNIIKQPMVSNPRGIQIQWIDRKEDPIVRISRKALNEWLDRNKHQPSAIYDRVPHSITENVKLGGGTPHASLPERVMEMKVGHGSWLRDVLLSLVGRYEEQDLPTDTPPTSTPAPAAAAPVTAPVTSREQAILNSAAEARSNDSEHH